MVRPRKKRLVGFRPDATYFKPRAVPLNRLGEVSLTIDELEALRLSDLEELSQADAARKMRIHQSTFQRALARAREKVTDALVNGKAIKIHGGDYKMPAGEGIRIEGQGRGIGRMGGQFAAGPGGICNCPKCGKEAPHIRGEPCVQRNCPECGAYMTRKD